MSEPAATSPAASSGDTGAREKRWPAFYALVTAWILPATTTRRTNHVRLISAWGVHIVALAFCLLARFASEAATDERYRHEAVPLSRVILDDVSTIIRLNSGNSVRFLLGLTALFAIIECGHVVLALILSPWGARDEEYSHSIRHALRRLWLHSGSVLIWIALVGFLDAMTRNCSDDWFKAARNSLYEGQPPTPPPDATPDVIAEYERRVITYVDTVEHDLSKSEPVLVTYRPQIVVYSTFLGGAWVVCTLLRGLGADRAAHSCNRRPLCRRCGYELTGLPASTRCPECGYHAASISGRATFGAPWEQKAEIGWLVAYRRTLYSWMSGPLDASMRLRLTPSVRHAASFLSINLVACGLIYCLCMVATVLCEPLVILDSRNLYFVSVVPVAAGSYWVSLQLIITLTAATLPAFVIFLRHRRNVLSGTFQAACYSSGWLVLWSTVVTITSLLILPWHDSLIVQPAGTLGISAPGLLSLGFITVNVVFALAFIVRVYRSSAGVRYACR